MTTPAGPQGKRSWSKCEEAEEKARKGEEGPVAGGTDERVPREAGPDGWKERANRGCSHRKVPAIAKFQ